MYQHIVVALGGSRNGEAILPHVEAIAEKFGARITLVHVNTPMIDVLTASTSGPGGLGTGYIDPTPIMEAEHSNARAYLEEVSARIRASGLTVEWVSPDGSASERIIALARETHADLIALATRGRAGVERALFGSVADSVLRHAPCPVLLVRADEDDRDDPPL